MMGNLGWSDRTSHETFVENKVYSHTICENKVSVQRDNSGAERVKRNFP